MTNQTKPNGGPAFPNPKFNNESGMTLRDYFAAMAMQGMCSSDAHCVDGWAHSDIAVQAYQIADAMLEARK